VSSSLEVELKELRAVLQDVRSVLILANQDKLKEAKEKLLPQGAMKTMIYELCDGSHTTRQIAEEIGKDEGYVRANLSTLRRDGLVRTVEKGSGQFHEQIF